MTTAASIAVPAGRGRKFLAPFSDLPGKRTVDTEAIGWGVNAVAVQADGKILIGGAFSIVNNSMMWSLARLHPDGTVDGMFVPPPIGGFKHATIDEIAVQLDGKIIFGGVFNSGGGFARDAIARLHPDGSLDATFEPPDFGQTSIHTLVLQPDGKVFLGGYFETISGLDGHFARLNPDGSADTSFNPGTGANGGVFSIVPQPDGRILVAGASVKWMASPAIALPGFTPTGIWTAHLFLPQPTRERWCLPSRCCRTARSLSPACSSPPTVRITT